MAKIFGDADHRGRLTRLGHPILDGVNDYTIYVDPVSGDDSNPGTQASPIETLLEATQRVSSLTGFGVRVFLEAGTHQLPDLSGLSFDRQVVFSSLGLLTIEGARTVETSFTVQSVSSNVVTASGTPGWSTNEHVGRFIEFTPSAGLIVQHWVLSNTADTLTLATTPTSLGGPYDFPGSGSFDIESIAAKVVPAATNPKDFVNQLYYSGRILFITVEFDGLGGGNTGPTAHLPGTDATVLGCKFHDLFDALSVKQAGNVTVAYSWFEDCFTAISVSGGKLLLGSGNVWGWIDDGVLASDRSIVATADDITIFVANPTSRVFNLLGGSNLIDSTLQGWFPSNVSEYVRLESNSSYENVAAGPKIWPAKAQPDTVIHCVGGGCRAWLKDSASATMQGADEYVDLDGTLVTYATYAAAGSVSDMKWNFVSG